MKHKISNAGGGFIYSVWYESTYIVKIAAEHGKTRLLAAVVEMELPGLVPGPSTRL